MNLFKDKKILIMGLGLHGGGVGSAKFFYDQGAEVLVTDLKTKNQLTESLKRLKGLKIKYVLGKHRDQDFFWADLIIKNPDVPSDSSYLKVAKDNNIPIKTDIQIFFELSKAYMIGITGTKGKSTTATLVYHFLKSKYPNTFLAGNIGVSPLEILFKTKKGDKVVLELSSFELEDLKQSPQIAVVTNILKDHLNRYKNIDEYIKAKKNIFKYQNKKDILLLNYDDPIVRKFSADSQKYYYSTETKPENPVCYLKDNGIYYKERKNPTWNLNNFQLLGKHNISNLLAAISVAKLMNVSCWKIRKEIKKFKGVPHRQEFIKEIKGVKYFNDTAATMPDALEEALKSFSQAFSKSKIILIAGGQDKKLDFKVLKTKPDYLVLLPGTASKKIQQRLKTKTFLAKSMEGAVKKAAEIAKKGDIVLLSPGAASFNLFKNEFDRGDQFIKNVKNLKNG